MLDHAREAEIPIHDVAVVEERRGDPASASAPAAWLVVAAPSRDTPPLDGTAWQRSYLEAESGRRITAFCGAPPEAWRRLEAPGARIVGVTEITPESFEAMLAADSGPDTRVVLRAQTRPGDTGDSSPSR